MESISTRKDLRALSLEQLTEQLHQWEEKSFRARQIYQWIWQKGVREIDQMTNLSKELRQRLKETYDIFAIQEHFVQTSSDGTIKTRFILHDGLLIESVLIPVLSDRRFTVCVSSQVGCSLACKFCATGQMKRMRNLTPGEIVDQVRMVDVQCREKFGAGLTNIVYMGMGEPLLNYQNVHESILKISAPDGLGYSSRRITISTAGIAKLIKRLADDHSKVNLALSLHAATDDKRDEIMPINEQNNLATLIDSITYYYRKTRNKVSFEYITFEGFNDQESDADNLIQLCKHFPVLVNIIEYNPISGVTFTKSNPLTIDAFAARLRNAGIMVTVRKSRGKDIDAACGQLANKA